MVRWKQTFPSLFIVFSFLSSVHRHIQVHSFHQHNSLFAIIGSLLYFWITRRVSYKKYERFTPFYLVSVCLLACLFVCLHICFYILWGDLLLLMIIFFCVLLFCFCLFLVFCFCLSFVFNLCLVPKVVCVSGLSGSPLRFSITFAKNNTSQTINLHILIAF